ncbi:MAG: peptidoglycan DD-metalloendopeptidase family protein [Candidatus Coproplasma sp.]
MSEEKKTKKKIWTYYLILGACILVIAAITVTVIFAVNNARNSITLDKGDNVTDTDNSGGSGDGGAADSDNSGDGNGETTGGNGDSDGDSSDVSTTYEFIAPVSSVDLINGYTFYHNKTLDCYHFHTGLDLAGEAGTPVLACLDGTVESITTGDLLDGNVITLSHANGVKTSYYFVDVKETLKVGDSVSQGDVIGTIAEATGSEYKEGSHLHFEVYVNGELADPEEYLDVAAK